VVTVSTGSAGMAAAGAAAGPEIEFGTVGLAAETLATETSPIVAVTGDVATLSSCVLGAASSVSPTFGTAVDLVGAADEVNVRGRCVATSVPKRDFPLGTGVAAVEDGVIESFDVVSLGIKGAVNGAVGVVALLGEPPVLTATPEASDVVCVPVDVEDPDGEFVGDPVEELVEAPDGELVEVPDEESDDESDGSARASPCPQSRAAPTPSVIIRPANRPISRTATLTKDVTHDNNLAGKRKHSSCLKLVHTVRTDSDQGGAEVVG
jgi:hypothetical protein